MAKLFADKLKILESDIQNISESFTKERIASIEQSIKTVNNQTADQLENLNKSLSTLNTASETKISNLSKTTAEQIKELESKTSADKAELVKSITTNYDKLNKTLTDTTAQLKTELTKLVETSDKVNTESTKKKIDDMNKVMNDKITTLTNIVNTNKADTTNKLGVMTGQITALQQQVAELTEANKSLQTKITQMVEELTPIITSHAEALRILIGNKELNGKK